MSLAAVAERARDILARVRGAAERAGRDPSSVALVAASKTQNSDAVQAAFEAGVQLFGESRVQELEQKAPLLPQAQWHFIGALQRNKARRAVELCSLIHSLDSLRLGEVLDRLGSERGQPVHALVEVNSGGEASKSGVALGEVEAFIEALAGRPGLRIEGLMTIPPPADAATTRAYFQRLAALANSLESRQFPQVAMHQLSMGMSDDFELAIESGATLVRVGTAIFGPR